MVPLCLEHSSYFEPPEREATPALLSLPRSHSAPPREKARDGARRKALPAMKRSDGGAGNRLLRDIA